MATSKPQNAVATTNAEINTGKALCAVSSKAFTEPKNELESNW